MSLGTLLFKSKVPYICDCRRTTFFFFCTRMLTLRMASVRPPGPLEEKYATTGAGLKPTTSNVGRMLAVGFLFNLQQLVRNKTLEKESFARQCVHTH